VGVLTYLGEDVVKQLRVTREAVQRSDRAEKQTREARELARSNAKDAAASSRGLAKKLEDYFEKLLQAARDAETAKRFAAKATDIAVEGEIDAAKGSLKETQSAATKVETAKKAISSAMDGAHSVLLSFLQKVPGVGSVS